MARIITIGLDPSSAAQLATALSCHGHQILHKSKDTRTEELAHADIVFANGEGRQYLPMLRTLRNSDSELPFVVVTRLPETSDWLDALEAGATDYCSYPFDSRQMNWLMESALSSTRGVAA